MSPHAFVIVPALVLVWCWPRSYGPSLEAFPLILGVGLAGACAVAVERRPPWTWTLWLALVVGAVFIRGHTYGEYNLMAVGAAAAVWLAMALGVSARENESIWAALMAGVLVAAAVNALSALAQYLDVEGYFYPWLSRNDGNRPYGNLRQPNHLATLMTVALAALWWGRVRKGWSLRAVVPAILLFSAGIALSASRTGLLELVFLSALVIAWRRHVDARTLVLFAGLPAWTWLLSVMASHAGTGLGLSTAGLSERIAPATADLRWLHWRAALQLIEANPWWGVGWREFRFARFMERPADSVSEVAENAHNVGLHLAAELGVPLALLILLPVLVFIVQAVRRAPRSPEGQWAAVVLVAFALHCLVEYPWTYMNFLLVAGVAAGAAAPGVPDGANALKRGQAALAAALLVGGAGFAWLDYDRVAAAYGSSLTAQPTDRSEALVQAQHTTLFRAYADYAVVTQVGVTPANRAAMIRVTDRLLHFGPDPAILEAGIVARCLDGSVSVARSFAHRLERGFPQAYAAMRQQHASWSAASACGF